MHDWGSYHIARLQCLMSIRNSTTIHKTSSPGRPILFVSCLPYLTPSTIQPSCFNTHHVLLLRIATKHSTGFLRNLALKSAYTRLASLPPDLPLSSLKHLLLQQKLIPPHHRRDCQRQLHLCNVPAYTSPRPMTEWYERILLSFRQSLLAPSLGIVLVCV
jgi:hypothetical protein